MGRPLGRAPPSSLQELIAPWSRGGSRAIHVEMFLVDASRTDRLRSVDDLGLPEDVAQHSVELLTLALELAQKRATWRRKLSELVVAADGDETAILSAVLLGTNLVAVLPDDENARAVADLLYDAAERDRLARRGVTTD